MPQRKIIKNESGRISEFRKDLVSGDWILVAPIRRKRPRAVVSVKKRIITPRNNCPFEGPKINKEPPIFWLPKPGRKEFKDWLVQIVPNKYPALAPHRVCPKEEKEGIYPLIDGVGFHEVIITRYHQKTIAELDLKEASILIEAFKKRYKQIKKEPCIEYILILHNFGEEAGATIFHPHSQLIAMPIIPVDVRRSLEGSERYYKKHKQCVHCRMIQFDKKEKTRVVCENKDFILICPYASHVSFEMRIYPKKHKDSFEQIADGEYLSLAEMLKTALRKLKKSMNDPDYNFFIHTAPTEDHKYKYYHWHLEIVPRISEVGGLELGSGIELISFTPEQAASILRKF